MSVLGSDPITGTSNPLTGWTTLTSRGDMQATSGRAGPVNTGVDCCAYLNGQSAITDQWGEFADLQQTAGGLGIALRCSTSAETCYFAIVEGTFGASASLTVYEISGGSYTSKSSQTVSFSNGTTFYAELQGTTLQCKSGTSSGSGGSNLGTSVSVGSVIASGRVGLYGYTSSAITGDNFVYGDFSGGATVSMPPLTYGDLSGIGSPGRFFKDPLQ